MTFLFIIAGNFLILNHPTLTLFLSKSLGTHEGTFGNEAAICACYCL